MEVYVLPVFRDQLDDYYNKADDIEKQSVNSIDVLRNEYSVNQLREEWDRCSNIVQNLKELTK